MLALSLLRNIPPYAIYENCYSQQNKPYRYGHELKEPNLNMRDVKRLLKIEENRIPYAHHGAPNKT